MNSKRIKQLCLAVILFITLNATIDIATSIFFNYAQTSYVDGEEQASAVDYMQTPGLFRWGMRVSFIGLIGLGLYFAWQAQKHRSLKPALMVYTALCGWSLYLLLAKTTSLVDFISGYGLVGDFAPATIAILGLFFAAAREDIWLVLKQYLGTLIVGLGGLALFLSLFVDAGSRISGRRYLELLAATLQICCLVPIFIKPPRIPRWMLYLPLLGAVLCGVLTQTRLVFLILVVQLFTVALFRRKAVARFLIAPRISRGFAISGLAMIFVVGVMTAALVGPFSRATDAFRGRISEDTRSLQAQNFFDKVPWEKLMLGVGYPTGTEYVPEGIDGFDLGYVDAMYVGGLPALFFLIYFFGFQGLRLFPRKNINAVLEVGPVCLATATVYFSSFVFVPRLGWLIAVLCCGRAYGVATQRTARL
jgi:hypothetical protein